MCFPQWEWVPEAARRKLAPNFCRVFFRRALAFLRLEVRSVLMDGAPQGEVLWWRFHLVIPLCPACPGCGSPLCLSTWGLMLISAVHACFFASDSAVEKFPEKSLAPVSNVAQSCTGCWGKVGNIGKIAGILRKQTLSESTDVIGKQNKWALKKQTVLQRCWSSLKLEALHSLYSAVRSDRLFTWQCFSNGFVTPANPIPLILFIYFFKVYLSKGGWDECPRTLARFRKLASILADDGCWHGWCPASFDQAGLPAFLLRSSAGDATSPRPLHSPLRLCSDNVLTSGHLPPLLLAPWSLYHKRGAGFSLLVVPMLSCDGHSDSILLQMGLPPHITPGDFPFYTWWVCRAGRDSHTSSSWHTFTCCSSPLVPKEGSE